MVKNLMESSTPATDAWTPERLQSLITDQIPEDFRLDYKGADALPLPRMPANVREEKRKEVGKDATAFANSDGGVIIYGIRESKLHDGRSLPERFDPVSTGDVSRDQLAQLIAARSEPRLVGVRVLPVQVPGLDDPAQVCYVVVVPKSDTAHMASDGRYYYRNEATTERMRDWQVRDAMNRRKYPDVTLSFKVHPTADIPEPDPRQTFEIAVSNVGKVIARNYCGIVHFPISLNGVLVSIDKEFLEDFHIAEVDGVKCWHWVFSNSSKSPLFPGRTEVRIFKFRLAPEAEIKDAWCRPTGVPPSITEVRIELFADEMPSRTFNLPLNLG